MFAHLRGFVTQTELNSIVIDVNGVGYQVYCSSKTQQQLPMSDRVVQVYIETHVREDHIHLYGFATLHEKEWFKLLTQVQGVGAKVGLALLSALTPDEIYAAILSQDKSLLCRADGVGPKLAERIVLELKDKASKLAMSLKTTMVSVPSVAATLSTPAPQIEKIEKKNTSSSDSKPIIAPQLMEDTISALVNLGYKRHEAFTALQKVCDDVTQMPEAEINLPFLIQKSLKGLSSGSLTRGGFES